MTVATLTLPASGYPTATPFDLLSRMTTRSQTDRFDQMLVQIHQLYTLHNRPDVFAFLRQHPFLIEVVVEASAMLVNVFGRQTPLSMEVMCEPEGDDSELFAFAHVELSAEEALAALRAFDEQFFLEQQAKVAGLFNVDVCLI
jgi:hypothetical protein